MSTAGGPLSAGRTTGEAGTANAGGTTGDPPLPARSTYTDTGNKYLSVGDPPLSSRHTLPALSSAKEEHAGGGLGFLHKAVSGGTHALTGAVGGAVHGVSAVGKQAGDMVGGIVPGSTSQRESRKRPSLPSRTAAVEDKGIPTRQQSYKSGPLAPAQGNLGPEEKKQYLFLIGVGIVAFTFLVRLPWWFWLSAVVAAGGWLGWQNNKKSR